MGGVIQPPQLGALPAGIPTTKTVTDRENSFLGAGPLFIPAGATQNRVIFLLRNGLHQGHGLQRITGMVGPFPEVTPVNPILDVGDPEAGAGAGHQLVTKVNDLGKIMAGVDMEQFERNGGGGECAAGQLIHHHGILTPRKQEGHIIALAGNLPENMDRLILQGFQMG